MITRAYLNQWTPATIATLLLVIVFMAVGYTVLFLAIHHRDNTDPIASNENQHPQIQKH